MKTTSDCIGIREYLLRRRLQPHHETATHGMFLSPLREERTPSFSVRYDKGLWYDFGLGEGGTLLQLVMRLEGCSMAEAIRSLRKGSADEVPFQPLPTALPREDSPLRILGVGEIRHPALIGYLRERGIDPAVAGALCREVHYAVGERRFFAIGFRNDAGGWELRNPRFKGSSTPKNITTLDNGSDTAMVFEGFIDFLSYLSLKTNPTPAIDTTVLNSVTNLQKAVPFLSHHRVVHAFLDNDDAGRKALARLEESLPSTEVIDQSVFYRNYKDLNDYWQEKRNLATPQTPPHERQRKETERAHLTVPQCVPSPAKKRGPSRKF